MKTVILCGGQGTRLREETEFRPKPMIEIGGKPILLHIMNRYVKFGHSDFTLLLGYRGNQIKEYFLNYRAMNHDFSVNGNGLVEFHSGACDPPFRVTLVDTGLDTTTGGRLRNGEFYYSADETFMVTYGDGLADINIDKLLHFHKNHGRLATVSITRSTSRFGVVRTGLGDWVTEFSEKPADSQINMGYMVFNRGVLDYIHGDEPLEGEPMQRLVANGQLVAYRHNGFFQQMDTYREYLALNKMWDEGYIPWRS